MGTPPGFAGRPGALLARGITHAFGSRTVLADLSLELRSGEVLAILGHNGAGKTTLFRILATLLRPTRGVVALNGWQLPRDAREVRRRIGYVADHPLLYEELSPAENLAFFARLYGLGTALAQRRAAELLARFGLAGQDSRVGALSRGTIQRVELARALLHDPPVLLLDDPYESLDPGYAEALDRALEEWKAEGRAVGLITPQLEHALRVADRIVVLRHGRLALEGPARATAPEDLRRLCSSLPGGG